MGKNRGSWQSVAAAVSLFGGLLCIILGGLDWAFVGLFAPAGALGSFLDTAGTVLLLLPLPLLALGAFWPCPFCEPACAGSTTMQAARMKVQRRNDR